MSKDKALRLALEALGHFEKAGLATLKTIDAITAIRQALEQPEPEPCVHAKNPKGCHRVRCQLGNKCVDDDMAFRTSPPKREPLTQAEVVDGFCKQPHDVQFVSVFNAGVRFAEAAHGIKGEA